MTTAQKTIDRPQSPQRAQRRAPAAPDRRAAGTVGDGRRNAPPVSAAGLRPAAHRRPLPRLLCACRAEALIEDLLSEGRAFAALCGRLPLAWRQLRPIFMRRG